MKLQTLSQTEKLDFDGFALFQMMFICKNSDNESPFL